MKRKINKGKLNYIVDVVIGLGFLISAGTGILLVFKPGGGFQGGRNTAFEVLGLSVHWWKDLHTWSSILMAAGVAGHLLLHMKWISCMTRNIFGGGKKSSRAVPCEVRQVQA